MICWHGHGHGHGIFILATTTVMVTVTGYLFLQRLPMNFMDFVTLA
jgi:hypothetical protein